MKQVPGSSIRKKSIVIFKKMQASSGFKKPTSWKRKMAVAKKYFAAVAVSTHQVIPKKFLNPEVHMRTKHVKLCSIEALQKLKRSDDNFTMIYGNEIRQQAKKEMEIRYLDTGETFVDYNSNINVRSTIDQVWNSTFSQMFKSRETKFLIISNQEGFYRLAYTDTTVNKEFHLIFVNGVSFTMTVADTYFKKYAPAEILDGIISIGFLNCTFTNASHLQNFMSDRFKSLVAVSIVNCKFEVQTGFLEQPNRELKENWSDIKRIRAILRFELGTCCGDPNGAKLLHLLTKMSNATSVSHRILHHSCNDPTTHIDSDLKPAVERTVRNLMAKRAHKIRELEFDMDSISHDLKDEFYFMLTEVKSLKTIVFNGNTYTNRDADIIKDLFNDVKTLRAIEIKSGAYFPSPEGPERIPNILTLFLGSGLVLIDIKLSGVKPIKPNRHLMLGSAFVDNFPHLRSLVIENSEITDAESISACLSRYRRLQLKTLQLPGVLELGWDFLHSTFTEMATNLVKLDLSGFTRWAPRTKNNLSPFDSIFTKLRRLKVLILDNLSINDFDLIGKLRSSYIHRLIDGDDPPQTSLLLLEELEVLSLQNTNVSNLTVRCVARWMPKVTRLNVSFTHVNFYAVKYALHFNPKISIRAEGCYLPEHEFSNHRKLKNLIIDV